MGRDLEQVVKLGRGTLHYLSVIKMQRELIEIEAENDGWLVKDVITVLTCRTKAKAIMEGHRLAQQRFQETGIPTALKVPVGWGENVLFGAFG